MKNENKEQEDNDIPEMELDNKYSNRKDLMPENPEEMKKVRSIVGDMPFLVPGIGAQGGDVEKTILAGLDSKKCGLIINSSRSIIFASKRRNFAEKAREEAKKLRGEINKYR